MKIKILSGLLAIITVLSVLPLSVFASEADLTISSLTELQSFAADVNSGNGFADRVIVLMADIDLGGADRPWTPIGTSANPFRGTFDGGYHVISGLYIASGSNVGLFGYVNGGTVQNVAVQGEITTAGSNAAGVVGYNNRGTVRNCAGAVDVTGSGGSLVHYYAGITSYNSGTVTGCVNSGAVTASGGSAVGGIVGCNFGGTVTDCYNKGTVNNPGSHVGGIVGQNRGSGAGLKNCYNTGSVTGKTNVGAVIGQQQASGSDSNHYYLIGSSAYGIGSTADTAGAMSENAMKDAAFPEMLGSAFTEDKNGTNDGYPVLEWESSIGAGEPTRPAFTEKTQLAVKLAEYIRAAVGSAKAHAGLSSEEPLLGNPGYLKGVSSTETDWMALAMGRFGYFDPSDGSYCFRIEDGYADFLTAMKDYIEQSYRENNGVLHSVKATEWHRAVAAISALGGDPTGFGTYNGQPIDLIADGSYNNALRNGPGTQGINGWIWGLIALDTGVYEVPADAKYSRETFITEILKMQLTDGVNGNEYGGWVLGGYGSRSDVDITAMAIQALAPYYNSDTVYTYTNANSGKRVSGTVRRCVDAALDRLGSMMDENGGFSSWSTNNIEGVSQVVVALCSLGVDPAKDARFITAGGKTLLDGMLAFRLEDGGFCHVLGSGWNAMATDQATYALVSYWRLENGMRALYDMRSDWTDAEKAAVDAAVQVIEALPAPSAEDYKARLRSALAAFCAVPETERRYVTNYAQLAAAVELVGGEDALDTDAPYITSVSVTKTPDRTTYVEGEAFDPAGMVVTAVYSDGSCRELNGYQYAPSGALTPADTVVYISYLTLRTSVGITVTEKMPWRGEGTDDDPYQIGSAEELSALAEYINAGKGFTGKTAVLTANIDLSGMDQWTPIGSARSRAFDGTFDGQGYVIDNLYSVSGGLFGYVGTNAVIKNVGVAGGEIGEEGSRANFLGGIANWSDGADFINCFNGADIYAGGYSGGIVGTVRDGGRSTVKGCYNAGNISGRSTGLGGIVGHLDTTRSQSGTAVAVTVEDCYNVGTVSGESAVGGMVGFMQDGHTVRNCYQAGKINAETDGQAGAIAGSVTSQNVFEGCYYSTDSCAAGIGGGENGEVIGMTADEMRSENLLTLLGAAFKEDAFGLVNSGYPLLYWQKTDDADAVFGVIGKIDAIGTVTADSADAIAAARNAYDSLAEELKQYVSNYDVLIKAEAALAALNGTPAADQSIPPETSPKTGDTANLPLYIALMAASFTLLLRLMKKGAAQ